MKRKIYLFIGQVLLIVMPFVAPNAQDVTFEWGRTMGGPQNDTGYAVAVDNEGNVYTVGSFRGTANFDPGADELLLTAAGTNPVEYTDAFVCKLNSEGNLVWARRMGGARHDAAFAVAVDDEGNVYVTGYFTGANADFGLITLSAHGSDQYPLQAQNSFVCKLDNNGNFKWAHKMGGISNTDEIGRGIATSAGYVYVTGNFVNYANFGPSIQLSSTGYIDAYICKINAESGDFEWVKNIGGSGTPYSYAVESDASGNVYITGTFWGSAYFGTSYLTSNGDGDAFISKLASDGTFLWTRQMGWRDDESGTGLAVDKWGNVYTVGYFRGTLRLNSGADEIELTSTAGSQDVFIVKLDADGHTEWVTSAGGIRTDNGRAIRTDDFGNVYVCGDFSESIAFGTLQVNAVGHYDSFFSKLDAHGNFLWAKSVGGPGADEAKSLTLDKDNNLYLAGGFNGTSNFHPEDGVENLISTTSNRYDAFIVKYGQKEEMPVVLTHFYAHQESHLSLLHWATTSEINASHFEIEYSSDGQSWEPIGQVIAGGTTDQAQRYSFSHSQPGDRRYYRLRIVDLDGSYEYSGIISLSAQRNHRAGLTVQPNPATASLRYTSSSFSPISSVTLFNLSGIPVLHHENPRTNDVDILTIPSGFYLLTICYEEGRIETQRVLIRN